MSKGIRIVFMGTPDFAVSSLNEICKSGIEVVGIITAPDKPAGRGKKIQQSAVKKYCTENNIAPVFQPTNLKDPEFQDELRKLEADLFVVVAFRMLPESIWGMPKLGTINLHASLLPNYRGAAPINWAVINGEKKSGVTTFFIEREIDTGKIIEQKEVEIKDNETAGMLHDKLMITGACLLTNTIRCIEKGNYKTITQNTSDIELKAAPKIFKEDCKINWNKPVTEVYNLIRGLSPYPAAWTEFSAEGKKNIVFKIFETSIDEVNSNIGNPGTITYPGNKSVKIACKDGSLTIHTLQQAGKKRMDTESFLRGFSESDNYVLAT